MVVHQELRSKKSVTLFLLWQEYRETHLEGYQYSWFCDHYRAWQGKLDVVMRQDLSAMSDADRRSLPTGAPPDEPARVVGPVRPKLLLHEDHDLCPGCGEPWLR